ncbi:PilC/PilY family type IV pilus protein [Microbulbifer celer]|uniref:PilC/PilY family type IV pilus protein n=1 Tax=Microbulbifer celer TaxID=435905 RepID=A0ABW3UDS9_9GAMM|nr:PilC/PilY family type IV pilus protein [Microbulbifer celer]UFN56231.1 hypothetical protein LPW13_11690 [Microbulbifer celer]
MKRNDQITLRVSFRSLIAAFSLTLATSVSAAPGELSDVPLYTRGGAEPNIMFVLDSSGSMQGEIWPPSDYESEADYGTCSNPISNTYTTTEEQWVWPQGWVEVEVERNHNYEINFRVNRTDGSVQFKVDDGGGWRTWNNSSNCFDEDDDYRAWIHAYGDYGNYYYTGSDPQFGDYRDESASGKLLNWYFSELNDAGTYVAAKFLGADGDAARSKVPVTRTDVMKASAAELVAGLEDVRVGLMQFDGSGNANGGEMLAGLTSVSADTRDSLLSAIATIGANGGTPLGETFEDVGRYFISGYENEELSIVQESWQGVTTETKNGSEIFESEPIWNGVAKPNRTVEGGAIQYYCQKSFMVALTDGEPTSDRNVSSELEDYDYNCDGIDGCTTGNDESMDDVVKALYDMDLRPDLKDADDQPVQHNIASYMIGFANSDLSNSKVLTNSGYFGAGYHTPEKECSGSDCSYVYSADNASQLAVTFNQIINKVRAVVGSSSSVAFNSTSLEAGSAIFAASFDSGDWSGGLSALGLDDEGDIDFDATWNAGDILDDMDPDERVMLTYRPGTGGVPFTVAGLDFDGSDGDTEADLNINTSSGTAVEDDRASERIAYLRGDRSNEGNSADEFRQRGGVLGDIVNSTPVYVGAPDAGWASKDFPEAASYAAFKSQKSSRTPVVYVGANDGFLHGFNATTSGADAGKELIAYSPAVLASTGLEEGLHALTSQNYLHKYYVDGTPTVVDAYLGDGGNGAWKSVLVGGLGGGGKGYFALDVTDPSNFSEDNAGSIVLWEFTDSDNSNLGYTFSRPQIGRMPNGKWAAIFGNGYNSHTGDAGLFIVYLDGSGHVYLSTSTGSSADKNGLSTPAIVDADLDGTIDRVYAGDLRGNMWAFDVDSTVAAEWTVVNSAGTATPLFTASGEPITAAPLVARNTAYKNGASPNLLVTFGTGQYLTEQDTTDTTAGGFYAVSDNGSYGLSKSNLIARTINSSLQDGNRTLTGTSLNWSTSRLGWYIQLQPGSATQGGERVVARPDLLRNIIFFNTIIPTGQVCSAGGHGWLMDVDIRTGLPPEGEGVYDGNGDGVIDEDDAAYVGERVDGGMPNGSGFSGGNQYVPITDGSIDPRPVDPPAGDRVGRLSWEELTPD